MKKEAIMKFKNILSEQKQQIIESARTSTANFNTSKDDMLDEMDHAISDLGQEFKMRMGNREALYLKKIEGAFQRITDGTYGVCQGCGGDISEKRLEARPTADLCIECKEESEKSENLSAEGRKPKSVGRTLADVAD